MPTPLPLVAIALGANLDDREGRLLAAARDLADLLHDARTGGLYDSAPLHGDQPRYLNSAVVGGSRLDPEPLLALLKFLELRAGRRRGRRWGPRALDLDLLLHGDTVCHGPPLTLPHPELRRRAFVLAPLADAAPGLALPPDGLAVERALAACGGSDLRRVPWPEPPPGGAP
jgi:2-amino-4-hydroxy-6-hydroxymethyldihydropteridine diphosphokinase